MSFKLVADWPVAICVPFRVTLYVTVPPHEGPVEAVQLKSISLVDTDVAVKLVGVVGALQPPCVVALVVEAAELPAEFTASMV